MLAYFYWVGLCWLTYIGLIHGGLIPVGFRLRKVGDLLKSQPSLALVGIALASIKRPWLNCFEALKTLPF